MKSPCCCWKSLLSVFFYCATLCTSSLDSEKILVLTPLFEWGGEILLLIYLALSQSSSEISGGEGKSKDFDFTAAFFPKNIPEKGIVPSFPQFLDCLMENNAVNVYKPLCLALQALYVMTNYHPHLICC